MYMYIICILEAYVHVLLYAQMSVFIIAQCTQSDMELVMCI